jgi:hypothetical protein
MSAVAAQLAVKGYYPETPGHGLMTGEPPLFSDKFCDFRTFAIHLARHNAWKFFRPLLSMYTRARQGLSDPLDGHSAESRNRILGTLGCTLERICAVDVNFSSLETLPAYNKCIADARQELRDVLQKHDTDDVNQLFYYLLEREVGDLDQDKGAPMEGIIRADSLVDEDPMDVDTEVTPAAPSPFLPKADPEAMDVDSDVTPDAPSPSSSAFSSPHPNAFLDIEMRDVDLDNTNIAGGAGPCATDVAATRDDSPMESGFVRTEVAEVIQEPAGALPRSSQNDTQVQGAVGSPAQDAVGSSPQGAVDNSAQGPSLLEAIQTARPARDPLPPVGRTEVAYAKERQEGGLAFTFHAREFLEDQVPNGDRLGLVQQIFSTLKKENDEWMDRHGSLGISDWRLERWAIKLEDAVAEAADNNLPDPESWLPTGLTDKQVYDRGASRIVAKMVEPLGFFKSTVRRLMRQITFVEDDKAVVFVRSPVERNLPPRSEALQGNTSFNEGKKRSAEAAFGIHDAGLDRRQRRA